MIKNFFVGLMKLIALMIFFFIAGALSYELKDCQWVKVVPDNLNFYTNVFGICGE